MSLNLFDTVLIANRGEIAVRVIRTLRRMGIRSVAVYSEADATARHVAEADAAVLLGPPPARQSYLDIAAVVGAAVRVGAQAVHPGYGFLSENAEFASALAAAGIVFIGPPVAAIATMADKIMAKSTVARFGIPVVPGVARPGMTDAELVAAAGDMGYPVLVKPSAGGGGKGMRVVATAADLPAALVSARRESAAAFGDDTVFLERYVSLPRHIEVQVLADRHGNVIHLGERECSLQRRHQKVLEEAPSPLLDGATRARIGVAACDTARSVDYLGAGTVEFIVSALNPDEFFFLEMNTRLQVEHPVTEMVTGWDLVEWQVRLAAGDSLPTGQDDVKVTGHAIEARVYAEDPARGFLPTGGRVLAVGEPKGSGVRVDSGICAGVVVGTHYDPMLAKVIAHGVDRASALRSLDRALAQAEILGVHTNVDFLRFVLADPDVGEGHLDTGLLGRLMDDYVSPSAGDQEFLAAAVYRWLRRWGASTDDLWTQPTGWRMGNPAGELTCLRSDERTAHVRVTGTRGAATAAVGDGESYSLTATLNGDRLAVTLNGLGLRYRVAEVEDQIWLAGSTGVAVLEEVREASVRPADEHSGDAELVSPMPGKVVAVDAATGSRVASGAVVVVVEAMKMEHALKSPVDGVVEVLVAVDDQVKVGQSLARIEVT